MIKAGDVVMHVQLRTVIRVLNVWSDGQVYGLDTDGGERRWRRRDCQLVDEEPMSRGKKFRSLSAASQN